MTKVMAAASRSRRQKKSVAQQDAGKLINKSAGIRVIGGQWRGRKLSVPVAEGLRPTPDRVRETLFNWLRFQLAGRRCLDVFTGSGALAVEALSQGAAAVTALDKEAQVVRQLHLNLGSWAGQNLRLLQADALVWLAQPAEQQFDLVFLDPPFGLGLLTPVAQLLEDYNWLAAGALIYVEQAVGESTAVDLPANWVQHKSQKAGEVEFALYTRV